MLRRWCVGRVVSIAHQLKHIPWTSSRAFCILHKLRNNRGNNVELVSATPLRKQLKEAARVAKKQERNDKAELEIRHRQKLAEWELTVGIEIHAQLNTASKLFSRTFYDVHPKPTDNL